MTAILGLLGALIVWRSFRKGVPGADTERRAALVGEAEDA
jgi:hypothetical protein